MTPTPCFPSPVQMAIKRRKCPLFSVEKVFKDFFNEFFFSLEGEFLAQIDFAATKSWASFDLNRNLKSQDFRRTQSHKLI